MTPDEIANKITGRVEFMLLQFLPRPTCQTKQAVHRELVREVKEKIAEKLNPPNHGLTIEIKV